MLSNDESKRLKIRFKKSKDFDKTAKKLRKEGYEVLKNFESRYNSITERFTQVNVLRVRKNNNTLVTVYYLDNENIYSDYKQVILEIIY